MKELLTLIKLSETHYIVVDDSEIKEGDWFYQVNLNRVIHHNLKNGLLLQPQAFDKKITHSTEPLEMKKVNSLGSEFGFVEIKPLSLAEVEEAIYGYSVEKMRHDYINSEKIQSVKKWNAKQYFEHDLRDIDLKGKDEFLYKKLLLKLYSETGFGYVDGFNAHKELVNDKLFTDMKNLFESYGDNFVAKQIWEDLQNVINPTEWKVYFRRTR